jgi:hypothetical protein
MTINLSSYSSIATALFCKVEIPGYTTWLFSNFNRPITINGDSYTGIGNFMSITDTVSELKVSNGEITIGISGIPTQNISDIINQKIKGSYVTVVRGIFDPTTGELLNISGNPVGKFNGIVTNYALDETWDGQNATNTINLICKSSIGLLENKLSGRRTNPVDQKLLYPTDTSMDRVPSLANANINFGGR